MMGPPCRKSHRELKRIEGRSRFRSVRSRDRAGILSKGLKKGNARPERVPIKGNSLSAQAGL
jgi:hypothetical protein